MLFQNFLKLPTNLWGIPTTQEARPTRDTSYQGLLGHRAWMALDPAIRERFAKRHDHRAFYGTMRRVALSPGGRVLALISRLFGSSLFPGTGRDIVTLIAVDGGAGDAAGHWERSYLLPAGHRFTVHSTKRLDAQDGLLECLGRGFVMKLDLRAEHDALHFVSTGYEWRCGPLCIALPDALSPGATHVVHRELGGGRFRFSLSITHPWFGLLAFQEGDFFEREA
ncbi:MAG: DUF4166 domain-containing protein [Alphaproteobacteria bacterium]|jgi:hypothetical protein|nr:DUF4166 domain-containing protein [Rhodospirillaceae bacterium]MBT6205244.1 DUF4166 domain-containing protein [Rhodospirillaceae bacterium]MBT7646323.1 DUF4166 domain-containing protein [Rhodospirillaceae bacterium]MDG2480783.1 DUF4166 domain-containing protein [Alphaproteobacteria bacterium]